MNALSFFKIILNTNFPFYLLPILKSSSSQPFEIYLEKGLGILSCVLCD